MQLILILKIWVSTRSIKIYMYKYKNKDKIIYSSYTGTLKTSYHLGEREIVLRWSKIWRKLATGSTSGQLYTERGCAWQGCYMGAAQQTWRR